MLAVTGLFTMVLRSRSVAHARFEVNDALRVILQSLQTSLDGSDTFMLNGSCPLNRVTIQSGSTAVVYHVASGALMRTEDGNPSDQITSGLVLVDSIDSVTCMFARVDNSPPSRPVLGFKMRVRYNDQGKPELKFEDMIQTSVSLR